jgi:hypothetical protein
MDWGALVNMGSAGAVIAVVIIFLKSNKERDAEWRSFFTELNKDNKSDICALAETMERMVQSLNEHDRQAHSILEIVQRVHEAVTKPVRRKPPTG